jgi:hypothetical protein
VPSKVQFINEGELKPFHNKQKLKQFMITKPELLKILNRILQGEDENKPSHEGKGIDKSNQMNR